MPHSCVKCNTIYPDQSEAILKGCTCGSRIFYFIRSELPAVQINHDAKNSSEGEQDKVELPEINEQLIELSKEKTVVIDVDGPENIRVIEPGSYELNVAALFKGDPVIVRSDSDVYYVKLPAPSKGTKR